MIRKADPDDIGAIAGFLERHLETSMFLLGNLEAHGIGNSDHPNGTTFFLRETGDGITGVFGCTNGGFLMCQLPGLSATEAQTYAHLLKGYTLNGMTGDADQTAVVLGALPVPGDAWRINRIEPLYRRDIVGLESDERTRVAEAADASLLTDWFAAYMTETQTAPTADLHGAAARRAGAAIGSPLMRLLVEEGRPTAMAAFNARAGRAVQVGGVYVPPGLRGAGRGGRVTLALLAEAAREGASAAILFAATDAAARAYRQIGFEKIGGYRIALLNQPVTLGEAR